MLTESTYHLIGKERQWGKWFQWNTRTSDSTSNWIMPEKGVTWSAISDALRSWRKLTAELKAARESGAYCKRQTQIRFLALLTSLGIAYYLLQLSPFCVQNSGMQFRKHSRQRKLSTLPSITCVAGQWWESFPLTVVCSQNLACQKKLVISLGREYPCSSEFRILGLRK